MSVQSFNLGNFRNPKNQTAINSINALAAALAARFDSRVGCTRSWDSSDPTDFTASQPVLLAVVHLKFYSQVIIDNLMNLELLFISADLTGNQNLKKIATSHATTTMNNHIRRDGEGKLLGAD